MGKMVADFTVPPQKKSAGLGRWEVVSFSDKMLFSVVKVSVLLGILVH